jgi:hypothetical protein
MYKSFSNYWFDEPKYEAHGACYNTARSLYNDQVRKYEDMRRFAALYKDEDIVGFNIGEYRRAFDDFDPPISYNVIRSCIDSLTSKVTLNRPAPRFLTSGGTEDLQEKAKQKEKFVNAVIQTEKVNDKTIKAFRDACIYGLGVLKVFPMDSKVCVEVVHPSRMLVDNQACLDSPPKTLWQKSYIDRSQLLEMFPNKKDDVIESKTNSFNSTSTLAREMIEVWEVWRLKSKKQKGRHMIFTENTTLFDEDYDGKFPFCFIKYADDIMGWYGIGLSEQLTGIQLEINELLTKIQANMHILSVPYILKERGSEIHDEQLMSNEMARLVEYTGTPPQVVTPPAVNAQVFQHLETLYQRAFEIAGISQLSATSKKPEGLNSGIAIRTFHDIETQRFSPVARRWENLYVDVSERIVDCARALVESEGNYDVKFVNKNALEKIDFLDVSLDEDAYVLQVYPASSLSQSPAGRLQDVIELLQGGMIDPVEGRQLLNYPDLEKSARLATAGRDDLEATFEHMLGKGKYIEPLKYQDLATGIKLGVSYYLRAKMDEVPQERLDLILRWVEDASEMLMPPPPKQPMGPIGPIGQSGEIIPQAPSGPEMAAPSGATPL